jgi:hypothetical protein
MGYQARDTNQDRRALRRGAYDRGLLVQGRTGAERTTARERQFAEPANMPVPRLHAGKKSHRAMHVPYRKVMK